MRFQATALLVLLSVLSTPAFAYNFSDKISEYGSPSVTGLCRKNIPILVTELVRMVQQGQAPNLAVTRVAHIEAFLDAAIAERALATGDRNRARDMLLASVELTVAQIQQMAVPAPAPAAAPAAAPAPAPTAMSSSFSSSSTRAAEPTPPRAPTQTPEQYLRSMELPRGAIQAQQELVAQRILTSFRDFLDARPTGEQIAQLINDHIGYSRIQIEMAIAVKREALARITNPATNLITNVDDYMQITLDNFNRMGLAVQFDNPFYREYKNLNTDLLYTSFMDITGRGFMSVRDLRQLENYINTIEPRDEEERHNRSLMIQGIANRITAKPARIQREVLNQIRERIIQLRNQRVQPQDLPGMPFNPDLTFYDLEPNTVAPAEIPAGRECTQCLEPVQQTDQEAVYCEHEGCDQAVCGACFHRETFPYARAHGILPVACVNNHEYRVPNRVLSRLNTDQLFEVRRIVLKTYFARLVGRPDPVDPAYRPCANNACQNIITRDEATGPNQQYHCQACGERACYRCDLGSHPGRTCEQYAEQRRVDAAQADQATLNPNSNFRPCPYCFVTTEKDGGCNHIHCRNPMCNRDWNWILGKPRQRSGVTDFGGGPRQYRVPTDPGYVPGRDMESAYPADHGPVIR